ncbi:DMT family transporter [Reinekea marina]|uniref:DMT family transporter n=1 Tax=Reinekea marina TaxID=1310421 RepID=A0ABV7WUJ7_9GAMM|nr:DMT family transporter [Reinekea marina]MDN3647330.1 DMT family transporter [Reinekea marina]
MANQTVIAVVLASTASFFWAANAIVGKMVVATLPAFTLSQFRWITAFLILLPFGLPKLLAQKNWFKANFWPLVGLSILSVTLYNTFQYWALEYTQPVNVGAFLAMLPVFIAIVSSIFGGAKQSLIQWITFLLAVFGALVVVTQGDWSVLRESGTGVGELLLVVAMLSWSFYTVLLKKLSPIGISSVALLTFFMGVGTLFIVPFWVFDMVREGAFIVPAKDQYWAVLFVALFPSLVSYFCWISAVNRSNATIAGLMITTAPLFNAILSMVVLNATISPIQWMGIALVSAGVAATLLLNKTASR